MTDIINHVYKYDYKKGILWADEVEREEKEKEKKNTKNEIKISKNMFDILLSDD